MGAASERDESGRPTVRMVVTVVGFYDAPVDPEVYEGTTDPREMAAIDEQNDLEGLLSLCKDVTWTVRPRGL